jgi:hypothetical protein
LENLLPASRAGTRRPHHWFLQLGSLATVRDERASRRGPIRPLGDFMDRLIGHYGPYCDYCLARWEAATLFDYSIVLALIITGGWVTSRMQSR